MNFNTQIAIIVLGAYLLGSIPFGLLIGRLRGIDIRRHGSGNIGATNVWRVLGKTWGLLTFACDLGKGLLAVILADQVTKHGSWVLSASALHPRIVQPDPAAAGIAAALGCILGHSFPVWLRFKGGKGVATSLGVLIGMMPLASAVIFALWGVIFFVSRYVSLASMLAALALPVVVICFLMLNLMHGWAYFYFALAAALLVILRHRSNIQRLVSGTESRFSSAKPSAGEARRASNEQQHPSERGLYQRHEAMKTGEPFAKIGVVGAGSWGTALALVLHGNGFQTMVWGHEAETISAITSLGENRPYLPGVALPAELRFTHDLTALRDAGLILLVTPSKAVREVSARLAATGLREDAVLLSCTKGVERGTGLRMSEIVRSFFPRNPIAVLSGPSHAEEVARKMPTAVVLGCKDQAVAQRLQQTFSGRAFRAYTHDDVAGIELGGALKNIFAIAAGVSDGLGLGDNSKAALLTRSLGELIRLGVALGGRGETFHGLSGIGDLMVTCFSRHSRNRQVGERLGQGEALDTIVASMQMVAEGVPTTYSAFECARKYGIDTPVIDQIRALLDGTIAARAAMEKLMAREPRPEV